MTAVLMTTNGRMKRKKTQLIWALGPSLLYSIGPFSEAEEEINKGYHVQASFFFF